MKKSYISPKVELRKSKIGKGLFAKEKILKNKIIIDFSSGPGKYLSTSKADDLYENGEDYMIQVDDDLFFAATNKEELEDTDFINHSCSPNCGIKKSLVIVAMRNIEKDEEITFDYAMSESAQYSMNCNCGSKKCRKLITGDDWRIKSLQKKYNGYFSDYLQKKIII